jgi:hypothetical protein
MQNKLNAYIDPPSRDACTWGLTLELSGGEAVRLERNVRPDRRVAGRRNLHDLVRADPQRKCTVWIVDDVVLKAALTRLHEPMCGLVTVVTYDPRVGMSTHYKAV